MVSDVHLLELTVGGALSAAKAAPIMAINTMKVRRILKLDELCLDYGNVKCEMVLEESNSRSAG